MERKGVGNRLGDVFIVIIFSYYIVERNRKIIWLLILKESVVYEFLCIRIDIFDL